MFAETFAELMESIHENAQEKGWWDKPREFGTLIALCHSELSEAIDADRNGNGSSEHIPDFSGVEEELADCIIRIMDIAQFYELELGDAIVAKMKFNTKRPHKHGGKAY